MKERPILFSTPMVAALLEGRKTQARRIIKDVDALTTTIDRYNKTGNWIMWYDRKVIRQFRSKYNNGDVLWVRETFIPPMKYGTINRYIYKANEDLDCFKGYWKSSIFMPKAVCRIKLLVKNIRVERLQDISEVDALEEGISSFTKDNVGFKFGLEGWHWSYQTGFPFMCSDAKLAYSNLWESINGKGSWDKNPWVWVIEFEPIKK